MAPDIARELCGLGIDYVVVVRGSIFSVEKTRPDFHEPTGFNIDVCRSIRSALPAHVAVFLQGSIVEVGQAEWAMNDGVCDAVEMTRAQIADPELVQKIKNDQHAQIRPCIRCNQTCQVRDARNPIVTCVSEPTSGHELQDPDWYTSSVSPQTVTVVGAGVAGLETARVAALRGHAVSIVEKSSSIGGIAAVAGPGQPLIAWLQSEVERLGVKVELNNEFKIGSTDPSHVVVQATGAQRGVAEYEVGVGAEVLDIADVRYGKATLPETGVVIILDPIGGPIGVSLAEELGDLAPANVRLAQRGALVQRRSVVRAVEKRAMNFVARVQDRFSGELAELECAAVVDAGFRLPTDPINGALQIGDCVAPRTILEAILEARRAALKI
jgi:2,4-dienoyl-CoA reductase (NADPH2)